MVPGLVRLLSLTVVAAANWHRQIQLRQSEIEQLGVAAVGDEDVARFDVAVDDPAGMGGVERIGDFDGQFEQAVEVEAVSREATRAANVLPGIPWQ